MESSYFISTTDSNNKSQIGVIDAFDKNTDFQIKTLKNYVANHKNAFQKMFILELKDMDDFTQFQKCLNDSGIIVTFDSVNSSTVNIAPYITLITLATIFILTLIIFYDLIKSYKQIGVEKLVGYDTFAIWISRIPKLILKEAVIFLILLIVFSLFLFHTINILVLHFLKKVLFYYLLVTVFTVVMTSLPFLYVNYVPVNAVVKNWKPIRIISYFNFFAKAIILTLLFIVSSISYSQMETIISQKRDKTKNWEKILDYVYIYELSYTDERFDSTSNENNKKWQNIYFDFNRNGGIMADFSSYSPLYEKDKKNSQFPEYCDVIVNPNYLKLFPVKDINGNRVEVSEQENDYIVLVPEQYKDRKREILDYFEYIKNGYSSESENKMKNEKIRIIWTENHQRLFSCSVDVGVKHNNTIEDPLVVVLTETNGATEDYSNVVGSRNCPFKIKVMDIKNPKQELNKVFNQYFDLKEIEFPFVTIRQSVGEQLTMANDKLRICAAFMILLLIMGMAIIIQSIITYIEQHRKVLAVKKFLGYRLQDKYFSYFVFCIVGYVLAGMIALFVEKDMIITVFAFIYLLVEFLFSMIYIHIRDRANIISITKGG